MLTFDVKWTLGGRGVVDGDAKNYKKGSPRRKDSIVSLLFTPGQFEEVSRVHLALFKGFFKLPLPGPSGIYSRILLSPGGMLIPCGSKIPSFVTCHNLESTVVSREQAKGKLLSAEKNSIMDYLIGLEERFDPVMARSSPFKLTLN
ncbi:hypothetical protein BTVI_34386 [Pitangus sulphuratus]|nr:hypothetical protein BTVI_34386 [Pitangus sulphuratus]